MAATSQVCSEVDYHPGGAGSWLMQCGLACSLTWQGVGDTGDSGFLYYFDIRLMLATFIRFRVTISHCPRSSYSLSASKYFYIPVRLLFFHCAESSLLNFLSAKFRSLLNHCLFLYGHVGLYAMPVVYIHFLLPPLALFHLL